MSRIGKKPIEIPKGVDVKIDGLTVNVKGPKGELSHTVPSRMKVSSAEGKVKVDRTDDSQGDRALHGLTRTLIGNMVTGVTQGYQKGLEITGTGYKAQVAADKITFSLGYSHPIEFKLPAGIKAAVDPKQTQLTISGTDKQLVGQICADIRALRPPDIYKGKGVRYAGQRMKLKVGKAGKK